MTLLIKILFLTAPVTLNSSYGPGNGITPNPYVPSVPELSFVQELPDLNPKNECNFGATSKIAAKKIKHFAYDCTQPAHNWLLIKTSEANYYDVLLK